MPTISMFYGIVITMLGSDHNPPHFHVKYGEYRALITIKDGLVEGKLPRRALCLVFDWLDKHKDELLENWKLAMQNKPLNDIEPLE